MLQTLVYFGLGLAIAWGVGYWWMVGDGDSTGPNPWSYRRLGHPKVAEESDPLLRRSYEERQAS